MKLDLAFVLHVEKVHYRLLRRLSDIIFILAQKVLKVRPTSPLSALVWSTPAACGTHILKSIVIILKESSGVPLDL